MTIGPVAARWLPTAVFAANQEGQSARRVPVVRGYRSKTQRPPDTLDEHPAWQRCCDLRPEREKGDVR
jgi:hypothetical protein